ncbi:unnamed protein product, partial [Pocillopora meandrina]
MVRDVAYFLDRSTAYLCKTDTAFPFSVDVTMMCLASLCVFTDRYLYSCPSECSAISRLQGNHTSAQIRSFILDFKNLFDRRLVSICQVYFILRTLVVGFLNYTRMNSLKKKYAIYIFVVSKLTVFVFFIVTFTNLMVTRLALSVETREIHKTDRAINSLDLDIINGLLQQSQNNTNLAKTKKSLLCTCRLLLLWQLVGALLYMIRDVACFRVQSTAYPCKKDTYFPFSEELTIVWLASLCICIAIFVVAFRNVPQFPGYEAILYKLMFVPSFLTLVLLLTLAICRY